MEYESEQRNKAIFPKRGRIETFFLEWGSKISWWEAAQDSLFGVLWMTAKGGIVGMEGRFTMEGICIYT